MHSKTKGSRKIKRNGRSNVNKKAITQETSKGNLRTAFNASINHKPTIMRLPRGLIMPDRYVTNLMFVDTTNTNLTSVGASFIQKKYRPTAAQDIDPVLGSTGTAGFAELAAFYTYYRVLAFRSVVDVINQETFGVVGYSIVTNTDPGTLSGSQALAYQMNPQVRLRMMSGSAAQNHIRLNTFVDCASFVGSLIQVFDDNYRSSVSSIPNNNIFITLVFLSNGSSVFGTNGVAINVKIALEIEFFERLPLVA